MFVISQTMRYTTSKDKEEEKDIECKRKYEQKGTGEQKKKEEKDIEDKRKKKEE